MKATCPKNKKHKKFITTVHIVQEWVVDEHGNFIEKEDGGECLDVVKDVSPDNDWHCKICGAKANIAIGHINIGIA